MKTKIADFPDWLGPMLVKELRQGLKTRGFVFSFIGLQTVLVLVLIYHVLLYARAPKGFDATGLGVIFWLLIGALLIVVTPLRAFNELAAERKANTLELIFMSGLSAWRIAFGKWVSLLFQALLFLLAVLPYAIMRYYFGAVDLAQDLHGMLMVMLSCAVLSAIALAISGMPLWVRVLASIVALFFLIVTLTGIVPMLFFGHTRMGRSAMTMSFIGPTGDVHWWLTSWNTVLVCLVALQVAAATVAPRAENHAGAQRFLALLLWLPLPLMRALELEEAALLSQLFLFVVVAGVLAWYHLSVRPSELHSHCRPFRGWRAVIGLPFQPGWPSAVVFLLLVVGLYTVTVMSGVTATPERDERAWLQAAFAMVAAALLCATFVWVAFRPRARTPLLFQALFLALCGVAVALIAAGRPPTIHLGDVYAFGILPPSAIWAMMDEPPAAYLGAEVVRAVSWSSTAYLALAVYALLLFICARSYWQYYFRTCLAARPAPRLPPP